MTTQATLNQDCRDLIGDPSRVQEIYLDALEAWRKNPVAWRIIAAATHSLRGWKIA